MKTLDIHISIFDAMHCHNAYWPSSHPDVYDMLTLLPVGQLLGDGPLDGPGRPGSHSDLLSGLVALV